MIIRRKGDGNNRNDSFSFRVKLTTVDIKKPLQKWLKMELDNNCYLLHSEEEFRQYFAENVFGYLIPHFAKKVAEWAFWLGMREGYICRSQHDFDSPIPLFYVPRSLLDLKCGPRLKISEQYGKDLDMVPGVSADFENQGPIKKIDN